MQKNIANLPNSRILLYIVIVAMFILMDAVFRRAVSSERNATRFGDYLATEQVARLEAQALSEQAITQAKISRSRELAAQSGVADTQDAALKVLLAVESLKALSGVDISNRYPSWTQQSFYDSLSNIGGLPLTGQYGIIDKLAFSPDGKWLATAGSDATIFLRNMHALSDIPIILRWGTFPGFSKLAFSPDGKWLAAGSRNPAGEKIVLLWDVNNFSAPPLTLVSNQGWVTSLVFSPDGRWLAVADATDTASLLWDMQNLAAQPIVLSGGAFNLVFSLDGRWLASKESVDSILWDTQNLSAKPLVIKGFVGNLAFSPDGKWLAVAGDDTIRLLNMKRPDSDSIILEGRLSFVPKPAFSPDGKWLASSGEWGRTVHLWDMNNLNADSIVLGGNESNQSDLLFGGNNLTFSPDGKQLAGVDNKNELLLWNVEDPSAEPKILRGHTATIVSLAFSPDGKMLATGSLDMTARLWDVNHPSVESTPLPGNDGPAGTVKFSPNGKWLAMSNEDRTIRLWDMQTPLAMPVVLSGPRPNMIFSHDNNWLVTSGGSIHLWKTQNLTANPITLGEKDEHYDYTIALSPDTNWLAAQPANKPIRLWNMKKLSEPPVLLAYESSDHLFWDKVYDLSFSPDGKWLTAACGDEIVRIWDMQSPKSPPITLAGGGFVTKLAFSPDGKWLTTMEPEGEARLWNMQNISAGPLALPDLTYSSELSFSPDGKWFAQQYQQSHPNFFVALWDMQSPASKPNLLLTMDTSEIRTLIFSPSGKWLAANSWDEAIYLWDMQNLKGALLLLHGYGRDTFALAFSPDEKWLATIGKENSVRLWQMNLNDLATRACQYVGRNLTRAEWDRYSFEEPYRATCPEWPVDP